MFYDGDDDDDAKPVKTNDDPVEPGDYDLGDATGTHVGEHTEKPAL